jgi:coenzyme F420 biosynthesis associated uncharacterized protein
MVDPVNWDLAAKVAIRVAGRDPFEQSYHYASLEPDFAELTAEAEELVAQETGLRSLAGPARAKVTNREGWVRANISSFQRLLKPLTERLADRLPNNAAPVATVARTISGVELGTMLGWMSTRVLGQYDLLLVEEERPEDQDIVYYVGPNVIALEKRFAFPPREFRLWLALHEVTHRAQFTGVPWLRPYFIGLVEQTLASVDPDPKRFLDALKRAVDEIRQGRNPLADGGIVALLAGDEQLAILHKIQGMMSLLEGHGDVTMDRAAADRIPSAERFSRVLHERRQNQRGPVRLLQQVIGLEAKLKQYEQGESFIRAVEAEGGRELLGLVWTSADALPTLDEIREPLNWVTRMTASSMPNR